MSKEKLEKLIKYSQDVKSKLESETPKKHVGHPVEYRAFLERELKMVNKKIAALKA